MNGREGSVRARAGHDGLFQAVTGLDSGAGYGGDALSARERKALLEKGNEFAAQHGPEAWLLISGQFSPDNDGSTENQIRDSLLSAYSYPPAEGPDRVINVLLDSRGGSLDAAFRTVLYLSAYARELNVYVPRRAKSASTLVALGADCVHLSAFGELGPLDTQIVDPRNPTRTISALDCYQSVDYVRQFGFKTLAEVLTQLVGLTEGRIALIELLDTASKFAIASINPLLQSVNALDFGGWGRSLKIGEMYAQALLKAKGFDTENADRIAAQLVYGYTHHPRPINYTEADRIGLKASKMTKEVYDDASRLIEACHDRNFVGFISKELSDLHEEQRSGESGHDTDAQPADTPVGAGTDPKLPVVAGSGAANADEGLASHQTDFRPGKTRKAGHT